MLARGKAIGSYVAQSRASYGGDDVGFLKILPPEQERLAGDLGERIGEAVAEIQPRRMTPFSEIVEGLARNVRLLDGERLDDDARPAENMSHWRATSGPVWRSITIESSRKVPALMRQRSAM